MLFKGHKISLQKIMELIPDDLLTRLAVETKVDYCAKVLQGERMFYLLLYASLKSDRISQRNLEDVFGSSVFKTLFNYSSEMSVSHSSISERLAKINVSFFEEAYKNIYGRFNALYSDKEQAAMRLIRVDSSMVAEASNRLQSGMSVGSKKKKPSGQGREKQQVKYTMAYDGMAVCKAKVYTEASCLSEDIAIPPVIREMLKTDKDHRNLYLIDRGLSGLQSYEAIHSAEAQFVCRIRTNRKREVVKSKLTPETAMDLGELELVSDDIVHLYDNEKKAFTITEYRLITARRKEPLDVMPTSRKGKYRKQENEFCFLTNNMKMTAKEISEAYKRRWDIEVFFRFIKQELNFKHFLSVNENGLQVMLYMTLIAAMLLMIYKRENEIGFTTAKRRLMIELEEVMLATTIIAAGGDLSKYGAINYRKYAHCPK